MKRLVINQSITVSESETFQKYLTEVNRYPVLSDLEEIKYSKMMVAGDENAKDLMIKCNLRFVISVAKQYTDKYSKIEDLVNEGNIGLIEAVNRFNPKLENRFISFAVWWIRNNIIDYKNNLAHIVRVPLHQLVKITKVKKGIVKLEQSLYREPNLDEINKLLGGEVDEKDIKEAITLLDRTESSFDVKDSEGEPILMPLLAHETADIITATEDNEFKFINILGLLDEEEREIVKALFGIGTWVPQSLETVGEEFGYSRERIRQIRDKAINKLRNQLT